MARIRSLVFVLCSLTLLVGATATRAQVRPQQSTNLGVTGQITSIDSAAKTLTVIGANKDGGVFVTNSYTTIMNGDKGIGLGDLKKGWHVAVSYDQENGKNVAQYITVVDTGP
jgi:Cu/Ag efflux protein CusF